jgi:hypothetical protein
VSDIGPLVMVTNHRASTNNMYWGHVAYCSYCILDGDSMTKVLLGVKLGRLMTTYIRVVGSACGTWGMVHM